MLEGVWDGGGGIGSTNRKGQYQQQWESKCKGLGFILGFGVLVLAKCYDILLPVQVYCTSQANSFPILLFPLFQDIFDIVLHSGFIQM